MNYDRPLRHVFLAIAGSIIVLLFFLTLDSVSVLFRLSMGSAYAALTFLAVTLSLGPWYALFHRRRPVSTHLRRDVAIWSGLFGLFHTGVGLFVHFEGRVWPYFFVAESQWPAPRIDLFGVANYVGLAVSLILMGLVAISNDSSMRALGVVRWQGLQRYALVAGFLTLAHAVLYQVIEKRALQFVAFLIGITVVVVLLRILRHVRTATPVSDEPVSSTRRLADRERLRDE